MKAKMLFVTMITILVIPMTSFAGDVFSPKANATVDSAAVAIMNSAPNFQQAQPIYPYLLQLIPGVVGDMTKDVPNLGVKPLVNGEWAYKIEAYTRGGRIAGFSRLEDYDSDILDLIPKVMKMWKQENTDNIRIKVYYKMSSKTIGSGGGGGGSTAGFGGGTNPVAYGSNASILPAVSVNTADPKIIIKFYLIK